jgi:hypothetical protein
VKARYMGMCHLRHQVKARRACEEIPLGGMQTLARSLWSDPYVESDILLPDRARRDHRGGLAIEPPRPVTRLDQTLTIARCGVDLPPR